MTTIYPNTADGFVQAKITHGEANLIIDPVAGTITVKPAEAAPADRYVTAEQFRDRFTAAELSAILAAQQTDPQIAQFLYLVATATDRFSLDDPRVANGLPYLVSKGLLASNRPGQIRA